MPLTPLTPKQQACKARAMAEIAAGTVGFHARIMQAGGPAACRELGRLADAELRARDTIIERQTWEIATLRARVKLLEEK